jgi:NADH-quinone oxidoreductase subunit J
MGSFILFIILAAVALGAAIGMVLSQNAVHSALFLILVMATLAVFYILLNAPFIAMVQIAVYAGAIMVLFLFVIMLLGSEQLRGVSSGGGWQLPFAGILAGALIVSFGAAVFGGNGVSGSVAPAIDAGPVAVGMRLFEAYVFPFEVTSILLLVAIIGAVALRTHKDKKRGTDA